MTVKFSSSQIAPGKTEQIPVYFHPMEVMQYKIQIPFIVNSKARPISLQGEGVPLRIELANAADKFLDFGAIMVGKDVSKKIRILNKSAVDIDITFDIWDKLPYYSRPAKTLEDGYEIQEEAVVVKATSS